MKKKRKNNNKKRSKEGVKGIKGMSKRREIGKRILYLLDYLRVHIKKIAIFHFSLHNARTMTKMGPAIVAFRERDNLPFPLTPSSMVLLPFYHPKGISSNSPLLDYKKRWGATLAWIVYDHF